MKSLFMTTVLLSATLATTGFCQDEQRTARGQGVEPTPEVLARSEDRVGLTIWKPEHVEARRLLSYATDLTSRMVEFYVQDPLSGSYLRERRDRFLLMDAAIGIQDFDEGRKRAVELLAMLDERLAEVESEPQEAAEPTLTRTVRPRTMGVDAAVALLTEMTFDIQMHVVRPTATLVLTGPTSQVARAESLLAEVDQPVPQMKLFCTLIEAADEPDASPNRIVTTDDFSTTSAPASLDKDLARGLAELMPGRHFNEVGRLMLRGAAGGGSQFEVSSSISGLAGANPERPARFRLSAVSQGWDAERGVLNLGSCNFLLERPAFQSMTNGQTTQTQFSGYQSEGLTTSLALRSGETTVVGSLGGDPVFIVLRFEIE